MKLKFLIISILVILFLVGGFYFFTKDGDFRWKESLVKFYNNFSKKIQKIDINDIGSILNQASKQLSLPPPLITYKNEDAVVLLKSKVILETNSQRKSNGDLPPLEENEELNQAALAKANDMFKNQYFEHVSPTGVGPGDLAQKYGYEYIIEGENLILGNFSSEKEMVQDWMDSPGHRANILNDRYTEIGVAIVKGTYNGRTVWIGVQEFGLPLSSCDQPSSILKTQIDLNNGKLKILISQIEVLKNQIENAKQNSPVYEQMVNNYNIMVADYNSLADETKSIVSEYNSQVNKFNNCVSGTR